MDASFERIDSITNHDNSDNLEIAIVSNFPCVVKKGEFREGDICFYIRDDAKLIGFDEYKKNNENPQSDFHCSFPWQDSLIKYLGSGGRVKTIKLRGKTSMGILLKPEIVCGKNSKRCIYEFVNEDNFEGINNIIKNKDTGKDFLSNNFGIVHWEAPITDFGNMNVKYNHLPENLEISDEENWENLPESDLHLGKECIITKKLDGSSCCVTCYPDGKYEISSRRQTFKDEFEPEKMNVYQKLTQNAVKGGLWYAKKHNKIIALRGECCCNVFNKSSFNKDCNLNDFFVYGCNFPDEKDWFLKHGAYGTKNHFVDIVSEMNSNGFTVKTVPVIGYGTVTKELLEDFNNRSWEWGEGAVIGVSCAYESITTSTVWHYKSKSREYLMKFK